MLLGVALALAGEALGPGWLGDVVVGEGAADGRLAGGQVGGELVDAPAVIDEGLQAGAEVGEAEPFGLLVELTVVAAVDREAALDAEAAGRWRW
jgi:hypothetical protein